MSSWPRPAYAVEATGPSASFMICALIKLITVGDVMGRECWTVCQVCCCKPQARDAPELTRAPERAVFLQRVTGARSGWQPARTCLDDGANTLCAMFSIIFCPLGFLALRCDAILMHRDHCVSDGVCGSTSGDDDSSSVDIVIGVRRSTPLRSVVLRQESIRVLSSASPPVLLGVCFAETLREHSHACSPCAPILRSEGPPFVGDRACQEFCTFFFVPLWR